MPYRFRKKETVEAGLRRIAGEQVERAIEAIKDSSVGPHEAIHKARQRCKKIRGLLRLVRPALGDAYKKENARFRDAAGGLSELRDAESMLNCFDQLINEEDLPEGKEQRQFSIVREHLQQRRDEIAHGDGDIDKQLGQFLKKMRKAKSRLGDWRISAKEFDALAGGFELTYSRARKALHQAYGDPSPENFHEWRKRAKYHGYHCRLLKGIWPEVMNGYRASVDELSDLLGEDHDLANIRRTLLDKDEALGSSKDLAAVIRLIDCRRARLQQSARPIGLRLFIHEPTEIIDWFSNCWTVWRHGQPKRGQFSLREWAPPVGD